MKDSDAGLFARRAFSSSPFSVREESPFQVIRDDKLRGDVQQFFFPTVDIMDLERGMMPRDEVVEPRSDDVAQMVGRILDEMAAQREDQQQQVKRARVWGVVSFVLGVVLGAVLQILLEPVLSPLLTGLVGLAA